MAEQQYYATPPYDNGQQAGYAAQQQEYQQPQPAAYTPPPPVYNAPPPEGGGKGGKNKKGKVLAIVAGVLAVAILAVVLVMVFTGDRDGGDVIASSSRSRKVEEDESVSSVSASLPGSSEGSAPSMEGQGVQDKPAFDESGFSWGNEPNADYDWLEPMWTDSNWYLPWDYLNAFKGGQTAVVVFAEASTTAVLGFENSSGIFFCDMGFVHGLPPSITAKGSIEAQNAALAAAGFPFQTHGDHGGGAQLVYGRDPATGKMTLGYLDFGSLYVPPAGQMGEIPDLVPVISMDVFGPDGMIDDYDSLRYGLARKGGEMVLDIEYEDVGRYVGNALWVKKNGKYGYFSNQTGTLIAECEYDAVWTYKTNAPGFFSNGLCPVAKDGKYGFLDLYGNLVVPLQFDGATHTITNWAWVKHEGVWKQIHIN